MFHWTLFYLTGSFIIIYTKLHLAYFVCVFWLYPNGSIISSLFFTTSNKNPLKKFIAKKHEKTHHALLRFRTGNHSLPIETGRHKNVPREDRICPFCYTLGDEYHFLLECKHFDEAREKYINQKYYLKPSMYKFCKIMNSKEISEIRNLAIFVNIIMKFLKNRAI